MKTYGLNKQQIENAKKKIYKNLEFLGTNGIHIDNKIVPFADFVANAYVNSDRYIAELQHRAWSTFNYAKSKRLKNIFITLTLPSIWHKMKVYKNKLLKNHSFGGRKYITFVKHPISGKKYNFLNADVSVKVPFVEPILDFSNTIDKYTPHNASIELSAMLKKLFNERSYRDIEKDKRVYFRVTEPHQDGTPHLHMSLFVPQDKVDGIINSLNRLFPAPASKIEVNVNNPVSYLMKYVLKTLDDLREDKQNISNLTLWYLYHGICRFYTSRTFVSLDVYRKLNGMYSLIDLTRDYQNDDVSVYIDTSTRKIAKIDNEHGTIYNRKPINWFNNLYLEDSDMNYNFESVYRNKDNFKKPIDIYIDGERYVYFNKNLSKYSKKPYQMTHIELYEYYSNLDIESCNLQHYGYVKNMLINRGVLNEAKVSLNLYNDDFYRFEA